MTDEEPLESPKSGVAPKLAVTAFGPSARHAPLIVSVADAPEPDATRLAVPSAVVGTEKKTLPVGTSVPVQALTVAVRVVKSPRVTWFGLAVSAVKVSVLVT